MGKIATAQAKIISLLQADSFFVDRTDPLVPVIKVPLISKRIGDIDAAIDERLAAVGIGLIVIFRGFRRVPPDSENKALSGRLQYALTGVENVTVNEDTAHTAEDIVENAARVLHSAPSGVGNPHTNRFYADSNAISPLPIPGKKYAAVNTQILLVTTGILTLNAP